MLSNGSDNGSAPMDALMKIVEWMLFSHIPQSKEKLWPKILDVTITLHVVASDKNSPIIIIITVMMMHETQTVATPAKNLLYAIRFFFGRMPQLRYITTLLKVLNVLNFILLFS